MADDGENKPKYKLADVLNLPEGTEPIRGDRDNARMMKLGEASQRFSKSDDGTLVRTLLHQSADLWWDVLDAASYYPGPEPAQDALAVSNTSFVSRLDQQVIDDVVARFATVDLADDDAQRLLVRESMLALMFQLSSASQNRGHTTPAQILTDAGSFDDPRYYVTTWRGRANMLIQGLLTYQALVDLEKRGAEETERVLAARTEMDKASAELQTLHAQLSKAREERAENALSDRFKKLSFRERFASWLFRGATFALLGGAVYAGSKVPASSDWPETVSHISRSSWL